MSSHFCCHHHVPSQSPSMSAHHSTHAANNQTGLGLQREPVVLFQTAEVWDASKHIQSWYTTCPSITRWSNISKIAVQHRIVFLSEILQLPNKFEVVQESCIAFSLTDNGTLQQCDDGLICCARNGACTMKCYRVCRVSSSKSTTSHLFFSVLFHNHQLWSNFEKH